MDEIYSLLCKAKHLIDKNSNKINRALFNDFSVVVVLDFLFLTFFMFFLMIFSFPMNINLLTMLAGDRILLLNWGRLGEGEVFCTFCF